MARRLATATAMVAVVIGCGSNEAMVEVRARPDTPDAPEAPIAGLWLFATPATVAPGQDVAAVSGAVRRTGSNGRASFGAFEGPVTLCDLGTSERPEARTLTCVRATLAKGERLRLRLGDIGLTVENG